MNQTAPLIKICGITRQQDADACARVGVDMVGFIFHPASPRNISPSAAAAIQSGQAKRVGLFVNQSQQEVLEIMERANLDLAQLHGSQDPAFCRAIGPTRVIRAFWPERYNAREGLEDDLALFAPLITYALLDAGTSGGGHGRTQDFAALANLDTEIPWMLAGGLSPETLPPAMAQCSPAGFDLNSGLESAPGIKNAELINSAVAIIRGLE